MNDARFPTMPAATPIMKHFTYKNHLVLLKYGRSRWHYEILGAYDRRCNFWFARGSADGAAAARKRVEAEIDRYPSETYICFVCGSEGIGYGWMEPEGWGFCRDILSEEAHAEHACDLCKWDEDERAG